MDFIANIISQPAFTESDLDAMIKNCTRSPSTDWGLPGRDIKLPNGYVLCLKKTSLSEPKDSFDNKIIVVQIAWLIARRIVCEANKEQVLTQGERIGMIRFGSRVDIYYENYQPLVKIGQKAISGETILAKK